MPCFGTSYLVFGLPLTTFLFASYFKSMPNELIELFLAVLITGMIGLSIGSQWISPFEVISYFLGGAEGHAFVIGSLRFPRTAVAFLAGAALRKERRKRIVTFVR